MCMCVCVYVCTYVRVCSRVVLTVAQALHRLERMIAPTPHLSIAAAASLSHVQPLSFRWLSVLTATAPCP